MADGQVSVRYMVDDVSQARGFYTEHFGFEAGHDALPAFAEVHLVVDDIDAEVERLRRAGVSFRNDVVSGPGGRQILVDDPSGNPIEIFQPAR